MGNNLTAEELSVERRVPIRPAEEGLPTGALVVGRTTGPASATEVAALIASATSEHLAGHGEEFRFKLAQGQYRLTSVEVHHDSHQITASVDAPWLLALLPEQPAAVVAADGALQLSPDGLDVVEIPAGVTALIPAGRWHGGAIALEDSEFLTVLAPGALHERSSVADLAEPVTLVNAPQQ